jgi:hypothetical protein
VYTVGPHQVHGSQDLPNFFRQAIWQIQLFCVHCAKGKPPWCAGEQQDCKRDLTPIYIPSGQVIINLADEYGIWTSANWLSVEDLISQMGAMIPASGSTTASG